MTKFLAVFDNANGERESWIYYNNEAFYNDTFSPECKIIFTLDLSKAKGKTYAEKKAYIEEQAIDYSNNMSEIYPISYGELSEIEEYFSRYGKRYGLLREFKVNAIC